MAVDDAGEVVGDRRQSTPTVNQHRDRPLGRQLENRRQTLVVEQELLGTGMELDAAGAEIETARRLVDRILGEVEPDERDQPTGGAFGERQRPVVAGTEARMAVRLVQAENEAARDPVLVHAALELLVVAGHSVDVRTEVGVGIEDLGPFGQLAAKLVVPLRHQPLGTL